MSVELGFAVWITGLPASGKSSITRELVKGLNAHGVPVVALESDEMRKILTPAPTYTEEERRRFYTMLALLGERITRSGINVIFDATANKRAYRDRARGLIRKFIEVYVDCPLDVCAARDPKGIYARAAAGEASTVPGVQASYEPPVHPDIIIDGRAPAGSGAAVILDRLKQLLYI